MAEAPECCNNICDFLYMRSLQALFKYAEIIIALLAYILAVSSEFCQQSSYSYFTFMTMATMVTMLVVFGVRLFKIHTRCLTCDCLHYNFIEFIVHVCCCVLLVFACIFITIHVCRTTMKIAMVCGWLLLVVLICDTVKSFTLTRGTSSTTTTMTTTTTRY